MDEAFRVMNVDEDHQRELWGEDVYANKRRDDVRAELDAAFTFLTLSRKADG